MEFTVHHSTLQRNRVSTAKLKTGSESHILGQHLAPLFGRGMLPDRALHYSLIYAGNHYKIRLPNVDTEGFQLIILVLLVASVSQIRISKMLAII